MRGSGDVFDVLHPAYVEPMEAWYCPAGAFFGDSLRGDGQTPWRFSTPYAGCCIGDGDLASHTYALMVNVWIPGGGGPLAERPVYQKRPTHLDDPSDWILILDETLRCASSSNHPGCPAGEYILTNHPGSGWGTPALKPDGTNKCTMDGAVRWIPEAEAVDGYPGCGGTPGNNFHCVIIE